MGFLKKLKNKKGGSSSSGGGKSSKPSASAAGSRPVPQDSGAIHTSNGSSRQSRTMNGHTEQQQQEDYPHHRGKNPHRRMNKEHVHHHPSSSSAAAATPTANNNSRSSHPSSNPSMALIPGLIHDLETAPTASGDVPARALRTLFSLSEHGGTGTGTGTGGGGGGGGGKTKNTPTESENNRTAMVRQDGGRLVPVLLSFLRRCERGSSEQYLALLVLNNISIPSDNKRLIAMDHGGAHLLSRLLCIDPSCHLMAIVLVNLSFADAELRRELVAPSSSVQLVDALSYTLLMATLAPEEHAARPPLIDPNDHTIKYMGRTGAEEINLSPRKLLAAALAEDRKYRPSLVDRPYPGTGPAPFDAARLMYAETARWCLCALKNLTRPSKDPLAAHALMETSIVPLILKFVTVSSVSDDDSGNGIVEGGGGGAGTKVAAGGDDAGPACGSPCGWDGDGAEDLEAETLNDPSMWDANSLQDAALFTILNMSAVSAARPYLREFDSARPLGTIIKAATRRLGGRPCQTDQQKQLAFQCLKARVAVAFLLASEGHFGQNRASSETTAYYSRTERSSMLTNPSEAALLVELLANALHHRAKEGPGGYSAATFSAKNVLCAVRCLLTSAENQKILASSVGVPLNALLLVALAQHAILGSAAIDPEAAEHASFSLYLLSNFGFKYPFLPMHLSFGNQADKVFTSYLHCDNVTPAGRHAASQLLLRLRHLIFEGEIKDEMSNGIIVKAWDYDLPLEIKRDLESIIVEKRTPGAAPRDDIFDRPILRSRAPKKGTEKAPWDNSSSISPFPNALLAVQQMSFGSTKVRHLGAIDDILIANNIAKSASGEKAETYNYWWRWQDDADAKLIMNGSANGAPKPSSVTKSQRQSSTGGIVSSLLSRASGGEDGEPISIFGLTCCAADTVQ